MDIQDESLFTDWIDWIMSHNSIFYNTNFTYNFQIFQINTESQFVRLSGRIVFEWQDYRVKCLNLRQEVEHNIIHDVKNVSIWRPKYKVRWVYYELLKEFYMNTAIATFAQNLRCRKLFPLIFLFPNFFLI